MEADSAEDEMNRSYDEKKQFWEKMSTSSSSSPPPMASGIMQKSFSKEESCNIPKSESTISSEPDFERRIIRKSESTASSDYEQARKQDICGGHPDQLVLHNIFPTELTEEEILQQLSPEKKEHFETFVRPELAESDHTDEKLEEKDIPLQRQSITIDKEQLVTRQIKGDILESEMDQQEESVMSDRFIDREKHRSFEEDMQQIEQGFSAQAGELGKPTEVDLPALVPALDLTEFDGPIGSASKGSPTAKQEAVIVDEAAPLEPEPEKQKFSVQEATEIATEFVSQLESKAIKRVEEIKLSQDNGSKGTTKQLQETKQKAVSPAEMAEVRRVAKTFVDDLGKKAVILAEELSPRQNDAIFVTSDDQPPREEMVYFDSVVKAKAEKMKVEFSTEISDSDLLADVGEFKAELDRRKEESRLSPELSLEYSDSDLKTDLHEAKEELQHQMEILRGESVVHEEGASGTSTISKRVITRTSHQAEVTPEQAIFGFGGDSGIITTTQTTMVIGNEPTTTTVKRTVVTGQGPDQESIISTFSSRGQDLHIMGETAMAPTQAEHLENLGDRSCAVTSSTSEKKVVMGGKPTTVSVERTVVTGQGQDQESIPTTFSSHGQEQDLHFMGGSETMTPNQAGLFSSIGGDESFHRVTSSTEERTVVTGGEHVTTSAERTVVSGQGPGQETITTVYRSSSRSQEQQLESDPQDQSFLGVAGAVQVEREEISKSSTPSISHHAHDELLQASTNSEDIWAAEEAKVTLRKDVLAQHGKPARSDNESTSSGSKMKTANSSGEYRKSGTDFESSGGWSSSGGDYMTAGESSGAAPLSSGQSRPSSSDVDVMLSARSGKSSTLTTTADYETAHSSRDQSTLSQISSATSQEFYTAVSSVTSKDSLSIHGVETSESSGNLGSVEISEATDNMTDSLLEHERDLKTPTGPPPCEESMAVLAQPSPQPVGSVLLQDTETESETEEEQIIPSMKRSAEMMFHQPEIQMSEALQQQIGKPLEELEIKEEPMRQLSESRETLSASVATISSGSDATIIPADRLGSIEGTTMATTTTTTTLVYPSEPIQHPGEVRVLKAESALEMVKSGLTDSTTSSSMSEKAVHSGIGSGELLSSVEELKKDESPITDQPSNPRVVSFETTVSFDIPDMQVELREQKSFDSEFGSRPESELRNLESRPQSLSEAMLSRPSSEDPRPASDKSDSEVAHLLKCQNEDPFFRPVTPEPPETSDREEEQQQQGRARIISEGLLAQDCHQQAEVAFSKHFTEVFDECHEVGIIPEVHIMQAVESSKGDQTEAAIEADNKTPVGISEPEEVIMVSSPPVAKPLGVKYWPPSDDLNLEDDAALPVDKVGSESDSEGGGQDLLDRETEERRRWMENQFDEEGKPLIPAEDDQGQDTFYYSQPLDQIMEEDEHLMEESQDKELEKLKVSLSNAPELDMNGRKAAAAHAQHMLMRGGIDKDDISMSSLQEFENLESQVAARDGGSGSRGSFGSQDSLEMGPIKVVRKKKSKSSQGDDVSMDSFASLHEFEKLEEACKEVAHIERAAREQEDVLSEIEEGHESQFSESSDSAETLSQVDKSEDDNSDDFEERMFQIDEIIKQAQTNVEQFSSDVVAAAAGGSETSAIAGRLILSQPAEMLPLEDILGNRSDSRTESTGMDKTASAGTPESDSLEGSPLPDLPSEPVESSSKRYGDRTSEIVISQQEYVADVMQSSIDSLELNGRRQQQIRHEVIMQTSTDSLELNKKNGGAVGGDSNLMTISTDSIEMDQATNTSNKLMTQSIDSLDGGNGGGTQRDFTTGSMSSAATGASTISTSVSGGHHATASESTMLASTDSLEESTSNNTRATASMLSSVASETLVDDLEDDNQRQKPMSEAKKLLLQQGEIAISDSDDNSISSKDTVDITHSQVSFGHNITEVIRTHVGDDNEFSHVVERTVELPADVSRIKFSGPNADSKMREYMAQFESGDSAEIQETEYLDEKGNIVKKKVVQQRTILGRDTQSMDNPEIQQLLRSTRREQHVVESSGEETYEELDQFGNKNKYTIKRKSEPLMQATKIIEVISEKKCSYQTPETQESDLSYASSTASFPAVTAAAAASAVAVGSHPAGAAASQAVAQLQLKGQSSRSKEATGIFGCTRIFFLSSSCKASSRVFFKAKDISSELKGIPSLMCQPRVSYHTGNIAPFLFEVFNRT